jgi:hypothetical protein
MAGILLKIRITEDPALKTEKEAKTFFEQDGQGFQDQQDEE